jgi:glycosyltransferase involved in cell wall biosynthesis
MLAQDIGEVRILVINNSSTDGTAEYLRTQYPRVVTTHRDPPLSVSASWNKGLSLLFDGTPNTHILVCNNDIELSSDTYSRLLADGGDFVTGVGVDDKGKLEVDALSTKAVDLTRTPHPHFSCYLISRYVWETVGKFDEQFMGAYCEDADYHLRMHQKGIKACSLNIPFYHVGSGTLNACTPEERERICKQADLNRLYFREKWGVEVGSPEYYHLFE